MLLKMHVLKLNSNSHNSQARNQPALYCSEGDTHVTKPKFQPNLEQALDEKEER